jgi:hypothetical protein
VFGFGRGKRRGQFVRSELSQSFDHLRQAATHAANGVGAGMAPRMNVARGYLSPAAAKVRNTASSGWGSTMTAFAPLAAAASGNARQAGSAMGRMGSRNMRMMRRKSMRARRRWPMLTGLLAAGAAVGAASAMAKRRRQQQWEEYDPARALDAARGGSEQTMGGQPGGAMQQASQAMSSTMEKAKESTAAAKGKLSSATGSMTEGARQSAQKPSGSTGTQPRGMDG